MNNTKNFAGDSRTGTSLWKPVSGVTPTLCRIHAPISNYEPTFSRVWIGRLPWPLLTLGVLVLGTVCVGGTYGQNCRNTCDRQAPMAPIDTWCAGFGYSVCGRDLRTGLQGHV